MTAYDYNPNPQLEFWTTEGLHFTTTADVFSLMTQRSLDNPSAQGTILTKGDRFLGVSDPLVNGKEPSKVLSQNDVCKVWLNDALGRRWLDGIYLVNKIQATKLEQEGVPADSVQIQLVGIGTALVDYQIFWHPHIAARSNLGGVGYLLRSSGKMPTGSPDKVLKQLFDAFINDEFVFTLADGRKISQALNKNFAQILDGGSLTGLSALGMEGALWQTLKRYSDAPWNELFVDVEQEHNNPVTQRAFGNVPSYKYGNREGLYLRPTPFNFSTMEEMAVPGSAWGFDYQEGDRLPGGEQVSKDLDGVYNFFWTPAKAYYSSFDQLSNVFTQSGGKLPIYDKESIRKYNLKRLEQQTEYVSFFKSTHKQGTLSIKEKKDLNAAKVKKLSDLLVRRTTQLHQWFGYDGFHKGTITTRGRIGTDPDHGARVGSVMTRKRDGFRFYVTGILQAWTYPGPHTTTWTVSRGHNPQHYLSWVQKHVGTVDQKGL